VSDFGTKFTASGLPNLFDALGDSGTYRVASSGATSTVTAIVTPRPVPAMSVQIADIQIKAADVASPVRGDQFTLNSVTWTFVDVTPDGAGAHDILGEAPALDS